MSKWTPVPLGDLANWLSGGTPNTSERSYWSGDIPWISAASLKDFFIISSDRNITAKGAANGTRLVPPGTTIFIVRGMSLMSEFRIGITTREVAFGQDCKALIPKPGIDPLFLVYAIKAQTPKILDLVDAAGHGTGRLQTDRIAALLIPTPSNTDEQRRITAPLKGLDDKIAVNDRIVATSLRLAGALFESVARNIAFGTETFGSVAGVYGGGTPSTVEPTYWDGGIPWTTPTDVTALRAPYLFKTARFITDDGLAACASNLYPAGSILMTSRATIGSFAIALQPTAVNQGFIVVAPPHDRLRWWLFHEMKSRVDDILSLANGSTFLEISRKNFKAMPVRMASEERLAWFDAKASPLHARATESASESAILVKLRDTLMPKLMSGEIRVRDAEKVVEEVT